MSDTIYVAPDIRKQKLEEAEEFINKKRATRMILATSYQQTVQEKAAKMHGKNADKFQRQADLFDKGMQDVIDRIEKLQERLYNMNSLHSELINIEGVINDGNG